MRQVRLSSLRYGLRMNLMSQCFCVFYDCWIPVVWVLFLYSNPPPLFFWLPSVENPQLEPPKFGKGPGRKLLTRVQMLLKEVDGSLTCFSEYKGFRRFFEANANRIGVTGTIQRLERNNVRIVFETESQLRMDSFSDFLFNCIDKKMIGEYITESQEDVTVSFRDRNFRIIGDHSRKAVKGLYSEGTEFDKVSVSSSNNEVSILK